jgi:hypothetical protein
MAKASFTDQFLKLVFRLTGSRAISDRISERRVERKWRETAARHVAAGGVVATYRSSDGEQSFLLGGEAA